MTIVQLRDKTSDTGDMIKIAKQMHAITKPAGIPLVINDRVDVALASGVEGVHIGQDDIGMLGPSLFFVGFASPSSLSIKVKKRPHFVVNFQSLLLVGFASLPLLSEKIREETSFCRRFESRSVEETSSCRRS